MFNRYHALMIASVFVLPLSALAQNSQGARDQGPGCMPERPAIAHRQGQSPVTTSQPAPIPCLTSVGYKSMEARLTVTRANTVLFEPAVDAAAVTAYPARSTDLGGHWQLIKNNSLPLNAADGDIWTDPRTGRIFQVMGISRGDIFHPESRGEQWHVFWSDDDGISWKSGGLCPDCPSKGSFDVIKLFAGPPPTTGPKPVGYTDVVYYCGTFQGHTRQCTKSLDGGKTFHLVTKLPIPPGTYVPPHPFAGDSNGLGCGTYGDSGVVGSDGTIYVAYQPCNTPYIAISRDEGKTWQPVQVSKMLATCVWACGPGEFYANTQPPGSPQVTMDAHENLYVTFVGLYDGMPHLAISRDHGRTWSTPMNVAVPGINRAMFSDVSVTPDGHVAIAYYGTDKAPGPPYGPEPCVSNLFCPQYHNVTWNYYLTYSEDPLDKDPLFWSASLNDPSNPVWYGCPSGPVFVVCDGGVPRVPAPPGQVRPHNFGPGRIDYVGTAMGPDGTPWASTSMACPPGAKPSKFCPAGEPSRFVGIVGRLALPAGSGVRHGQQ